MKKDFVSIKDLNLEDINYIFKLAQDLKENPHSYKTALGSKSIALIFEKPSNRTRVSFEVGIWQLGAQSIHLGPENIKLGVREAIKDAAQTLSRYVDAIILRTFSQEILEELALHASIPVINGLTDLLHPCQALADIFTLKEKLPQVDKKTIAFIGDGNNVCHSLSLICSKMGINLNIASPKKFGPKQTIINDAEGFAKISGAQIKLFNMPGPAVKGADVIYTDVWASMGKEKETKKRQKIFSKFQVNAKLISAAGTKPFIMHCLPAHRNEEITDEVLDSKASIVFDQAENRLHVQKAILLKLLKNK